MTIEAKSASKRAWSLALITWVIGAVLLVAAHFAIGEIDSRNVRWWLDAGLYVVAFFYFLAIGPLHEYFLRRQ